MLHYKFIAYGVYNSLRSLVKSVQARPFVLHEHISGTTTDCHFFHVGQLFRLKFREYPGGFGIVGGYGKIPLPVQTDCFPSTLINLVYRY